MVITSNNIDQILRLKSQFFDTFEMTVFGLLHFFLGIQVLPFNNGLFIYQSKCILDLLKLFNIDDYMPCATPFHSCIKT